MMTQRHLLSGRAAVLLGALLFSAASAAPPVAEPPDPPQSPDAPVQVPSPALLMVAAPDDEARLRLRGLDLDIIDERPGHSARLLAWPGTMEKLKAAGLRYEVLEPDFGAALARAAGLPPGPPARRASAGEPAGATPAGEAGAAAPGSGPVEPQAPAVAPPIGQGSMAGYPTLAEVEAFLNDLAANDVHGIVGSVTQIGLTRQNRPIRALRIAKESLPDHSRPRVLFTGLHHAREPLGMLSVMEFMRRLVADYGVDPDLTYLVDKREIWFVPMVNPDGYQINQNAWFNTGSFGLWRKNARDNDNNGLIDTQDGVDINRNYGYRWGYDSIGSSGTPSSLEYRGTAAWSEPETRALRDFGVAHQFSIANNYHTYGELYIYPWGYNAAGCPDSVQMRRLIEKMTPEFSYSYGVAADLLYKTNGDANDWFYGEQTTKPKCWSFTPEIGDKNDNFWPPQARITTLAGQQFRANVDLAYAAGAHVWAERADIVSYSGWLHPGGSAQVSLTLRNTGLAASGGSVQVTASTSVPGISITDAGSSFGVIASNATATPAGGDLLGLSASVYVPSGTEVPLNLAITDPAGYVYHQAISIIVGEPVTAFFDDGNGGTGKWVISSRWGIQDLAGDNVFADSPNAKYAVLAAANMTTAAPIDLSGAGHAWLTFQTSYDIELGADCGRVQVSTDGGVNWTSLPGRLTRPGHGQAGAYATGTQGLNEPVYDATQRIEAVEFIDLSAYAGLTDVRLRFRFTSDDSGRREGWFVDDIAVLAYASAATGVAEDAPAVPAPRLAPAWPNPFRGGTRFTATFDRPTVFEAAVYSVDGRRLAPLAEGIAAAGPRDIYWDGRLADGREAPSGTYFLRLQVKDGSASQRVVRVR